MQKITDSAYTTFRKEAWICGIRMLFLPTDLRRNSADSAGTHSVRAAASRTICNTAAVRNDRREPELPTHLTVRGLVIRETPVHDADKLFDLFTENGILTVQAKSVRKAGSKYGAVTQLFSYGEFCLRENGNRHYLDSAVSLELFYGIRNDLNALALASYFSELIRKTATDQPQPQLLRLYLLSLHHLSQHDRPLPLVKAVFELRLMTELGLMPNLVCCPVCMAYLPVQPVLRIGEADLICKACRTEISPLDFETKQSVLLAARQAVYAEPDRIFQFRLKGESESQFAEYAEQYLMHRLALSLPTLKFYHELTDPGGDLP